jgi:hypothetical protein
MARDKSLPLSSNMSIRYTHLVTFYEDDISHFFPGSVRNILAKDYTPVAIISFWFSELHEGRHTRVPPATGFKIRRHLQQLRIILPFKILSGD